MSSKLIPALRYRDVDAALAFLQRAFGFELHAAHRNGDGAIRHAELVHGSGMVMISPDRGDAFGQLMSADGPTRATLYVVVDDVDAHHDRAAAAGAEVVYPLTDQDYGSRDYSVKDPEGVLWSFGTYDPWRTA